MINTKINLGPLLIGIENTSLTNNDIIRLKHPAVGGVILFKRNYSHAKQLTALTKSIRNIKDPRLVICVDQEGGRVQRFKEHGFSSLKPLSEIGITYTNNSKQALLDSFSHGLLMAKELLQCGVDFSFAPVIDLYNSNSKIIANRAFHQNPDIVTLLAREYIKGMHKAGMSCVLKHFPGHGSVSQDSHLECAIDKRKFKQIEKTDLQPFIRLTSSDNIQGVMVAHISYPNITTDIASFSKFWITETLKDKLKFQGLIFSDDLGMFAASSICSSSFSACEKFFNAGGDIALLCNDFDQIEDTLAKINLENDKIALLQPKWINMYGKNIAQTL